MQTLRDLRAGSSGQSPGRRPPPSMRGASTWKGAPPLPNHPRPTSAVGSQSAAGCGGTGGAFALPYPPEPTGAVGSPPAFPARLACGDRAGPRTGMPHRRRGDHRPLDGAGSAAPPASRGRARACGARTRSAHPAERGTGGAGQGARGPGSAPHPARSGPPSLPPEGRRAGRTGLSDARAADGGIGAATRPDRHAAEDAIGTSRGGVQRLAPRLAEAAA